MSKYQYIRAALRQGIVLREVVTCANCVSYDTFTGICRDPGSGKKITYEDFWCAHGKTRVLKAYHITTAWAGCVVFGNSWLEVRNLLATTEDLRVENSDIKRLPEESSLSLPDGNTGVITKLVREWLACTPRHTIVWL